MTPEQSADALIDARMLAYARRIAGDFWHRCGRTIPFEELHSDANYALLLAARRYDPASGKKFINYAYLRINGALRDAARRHDPYTRTERAAIRRHEADAATPLTRHQARAVRSRRVLVPLDELARPDEERDALEQLDTEIMRLEGGGVPEARQLDPAQLWPLLDHALTPAERLAVRRIVLDDQTAVAVAVELQRTPTRVGQLLKSGLAKLRAAYLRSDAAVPQPLAA